MVDDTKRRFEAAAHEARCRECRVTWWSWLLRLLDRDEGYTPLPHLTINRISEENERLRHALTLCRDAFQQKVKNDVVLAADLNLLSVCNHALREDER